MEFHILSETGSLHNVLLGSIRNFTLNTPINVTQQHYYATNPPEIGRMFEQEDRFIEVLEKYHVTIHQLPLFHTSFTQFFVRDIAVVIGETLIICAMKEAIRKPETAALEQMLVGTNQPVLRVDDGFLEGGDILIDQTTLYVGVGERTNIAGLAYLKRHFGTMFEIIPLQLAESFLHLDVVVNLLGKGDALIYPAALSSASQALLARRYNIIEITAEEQFALATNVLSLSPETVITDERNTRINELLSNKGYEVVPIAFDEIGKMGGSFRCGSCPLRRD